MRTGLRELRTQVLKSALHLTHSFNQCVIHNAAKPAEYTVTKDWTIVNDGGNVVQEDVYVTIECNAPINQPPCVVEAENECAGYATLSAGEKHRCTIYNSVFFEGIPTLSQYGMAIMARLLLAAVFFSSGLCTQPWS